ncbi:MAG: SRPBCC family protein [Actinomycetota bacterium]
MGHRVERTFEVGAAPEAAFDYVADFSSAQEWDPGIPTARRLDAGPIGVGSRFELTSRFGGTEQLIHYEISEFDRPRRVTFAGDGKNFRGTDTISFASDHADRTRVTYVADLGLKGVAALALPFLRGRLDSMSDDAVAGLKTALDRLP